MSLSAAELVYAGGCWTVTGPYPAGPVSHDADGGLDGLLVQVALSGERAARALASPLGGAERQGAFTLLHGVVMDLRRLVDGRMAAARLDAAAAPDALQVELWRECVEAGWYLAVCMRSLMGTDQPDEDVIADNAEDVMRHVCFFGLAGGLLAPARRRLRPLPLDRRDPVSVWDHAHRLVTLTQEPGRVAVSFPALGEACPLSRDSGQA